MHPRTQGRLQAFLSIVKLILCQLPFLRSSWMSREIASPTPRDMETIIQRITSVNTHTYTDTRTHTHKHTHTDTPSDTHTHTQEEKEEKVPI